MIDIVKLQFKAGKGGDGRLSFYRAKFITKGGPDGGDGGDGGSIYLVGKKELNTLYHFTGRKSFDAQRGEDGGAEKRSGKKGDDLIIEVPVGTIVWKLEQEIQLPTQKVADPEDFSPQEQVSQKALQTLRLDDIQKTKVVEVLKDGEKILLCKGGKGGRGNDRFKSSVNTTPQEFERGTPGEEMDVILELKLLADIGLVGFPNAGKSTFLSQVTKANPRIASYPFTTLEPNLGVMNVGEGKEVIIADIPGLIEGASKGKGLGVQFLRHVERCKALLYMLYLEEEVIFDENLSVEEKATKAVGQLNALQKELKDYHPSLLELPHIITVSKSDLYPEELRAEIKRQLRGNKSIQKDPILWSSVSHENVGELKQEIYRLFN